MKTKEHSKQLVKRLLKSRDEYKNISKSVIKKWKEGVSGFLFLAYFLKMFEYCLNMEKGFTTRNSTTMNTIENTP